jgi:biotin carboxyl carrier protein
MKYQAKISGKKQEWLDASPEVMKDWSFEKRAGGWIIATNATTQERVRFYYARSKQQFWAKIGGKDLFGERNPVNRAAGANDSASDFTAQFPGKVRKIMATEGQTVAEGAPLLMIEAMKMEFAIKATNPGIVKKILVTEGQQLTPGQKLLDFEDAKK